MTEKYLQHIFALFLSGVAVIVCINWLVNPYTIFSAPNLSGLNTDKVDFIKHLRITKPYLVIDRKPQALILGTSRAGQGIPSQHAGWEDLAVYNMSLPGSSMYELMRYIQHANAVRPIRKIVLGLDFRLFSRQSINASFSEKRLLVDKKGLPNKHFAYGRLTDYASTLFSFDALKASLKKVRQQGWSSHRLEDDGSWARIKPTRDYKKVFDAYTKASFRRLNDISPVLTGLEHYRALLRLAHNNGIDLRMFISMSHAWHWEVIQELDLSTRFERLKRTLVRINEEEAEHAQKPTFPLWDFSGHNELSNEEIPQAKNTTMTWFWDPIHYKPNAGSRILDHLFSAPNAHLAEPGITNIGYLLTTETVELVLGSQREAQKMYRRSRASEITKIRVLKESFLNNRPEPK